MLNSKVGKVIEITVTTFIVIALVLMMLGSLKEKHDCDVKGGVVLNGWNNVPVCVVLSKEK